MNTQKSISEQFGGTYTRIGDYFVTVKPVAGFKPATSHEKM